MRYREYQPCSVLTPYIECLWFVSHDRANVAFENLQHDFPQRIIYWMEKDGSLRAKVEGTMNGKAASEEWSWTKAKN
jgi:hypothetical protein